MNPKTDLGHLYARHWSAYPGSNKRIAAAELEADRQACQKNYATIARDYYDLTTTNIELGWNSRFHFCPFTDPHESIDASLKQHEHFLALMMGLKPGMRGLDAGCGIGAPSRDLARFAGVHITGVSINKTHVDRARIVAREEGLKDKLDYVEGDFMNMSMFEDNTFDFAYAIEATVYAPDLRACYSEIARVLRPGGVFAVYEWVTTDSFDSHNPQHLEIRHRIERGDGVTNIVSAHAAIEAITHAGLHLEHHQDRAHASLADKQWWYPLDGQTSQTTTCKDWCTVFRLRKGFWRYQCALVWALEKAGLVARGRVEALKTQSMSVWGLRDAARLGIFTPMYMMVARKPVAGWKPRGE